jgi:hypothetical protein
MLPLMLAECHRRLIAAAISDASVLIVCATCTNPQVVEEVQECVTQECNYICASQHLKLPLMSAECHRRLSSISISDELVLIDQRPSYEPKSLRRSSSAKHKNTIKCLLNNSQHLKLPLMSAECHRRLSSITISDELVLIDQCPSHEPASR